ncbi:MAG: FAD-binding oxidoreductase [Rubellimicrobium sp.]|nr:FAD-binding oxidoreductase [Rubellimicrobium sp.]
MNPLYLNDKPCQYPESWYAETAPIGPQLPALEQDMRVDLAVIGAGFTGLWAAKTAAEAGLNVILVDAHRVGFGASGRNGGQVGTGFNKGQKRVEKLMGKDGARLAWDLAEEAKAQLRDFCAEHAPEAGYTPGVVYGEYSVLEAKDARREADHLARVYGYEQIEGLNSAGIQEIVKTPLYKGGTLDMGAGHLHPLRYALALARQAEVAGAMIFEGTEVTKIEKGTPAVLHTPKGKITADHVIVAGNGYLPLLDDGYAARVMPINSFIAATEPLGERWTEIMTRDVAVADSKFVVNYYRMSEDRRFLFGGRESYGLGFPVDIKTALVRRMVTLFPQLGGVEISHVWGGTLGITMSRLPYLSRLAPNVLAAGGFSGHGVALTGIAGRVMAEAVLGQAGRFDVMAKLPVTTFPGGAKYRTPLLTLAMTWFALRDRLGI